MEKPIREKWQFYLLLVRGIKKLIRPLIPTLPCPLILGQHLLTFFQTFCERSLILISRIQYQGVQTPIKGFKKFTGRAFLKIQYSFSLLLYLERIIANWEESSNITNVIRPVLNFFFTEKCYKYKKTQNRL